jgi:hypothetical protein
MDNRAMALPSHPRPRFSRSAAARVALAALLAVLVLIPAAGAATIGMSAKGAKGDRGVFVSKGVGRQVFTGGGGVAYGVIFSGASLVVVDYSPTHDMKVDAPVIPTTNADGSRTYVPAGGASRVAFRISGTLYRVTVTGSSTFNAAGVFGRLQARGKGTMNVNGVRSRWSGPAITVGRVPKDVKKLFQAAAAGQPVPVVTPPAPPDPPSPPATTTTSGS